MPDDHDRESDSASKADRLAAWWMDYHVERGSLCDRSAMSVVEIAFDRRPVSSPPLFGEDSK